MILVTTKKVEGIILGFILTMTATLNGLSALSESERVFYKDHQDAFAQKIFVDNPEKALWSSGKLFRSAASFLIPAAFSIMITEASRQGHFVSDSDRHHKIISLTIGSMVGAFFLWLYRKHANYVVNKNAMEQFFDEYEGNNGLRACLPQSLVTTIDTMFKEYQKNGETYFTSDVFNALLEAIQDDVAKNNQTKLDKKTNKTLIKIVITAAIVLVLINAFILDDVQHGLHFLHENVDYWGARAEITRKANLQ